MSNKTITYIIIGAIVLVIAYFVYQALTNTNPPLNTISGTALFGNSYNSGISSLLNPSPSISTPITGPNLLTGTDDTNISSGGLGL